MDENPFDLLDTEARRLDSFYGRLAGDQWDAPTRCAGWTRKDLLAHLVNLEDYTRACLDDTVAEYLGEMNPAEYERLNDELVRQRSGATPTELLAEWRTKIADNQRRLRERGTDASLATSVGPYPLGRQAFYLACELAIHADDAGVPVSDAERPARLRWRARFGVDALAENRRNLSVEVRDGGRYTVRRDDGPTAELSEEELVEATSGRLPDSHPIPDDLRRALVVLA